MDPFAPLGPPPPPQPQPQPPPPSTFDLPPTTTTFPPVQPPAYVINPTSNFNFAAPPPPPVPPPFIAPPAPATATAPHHPPYAQMITEAITALNDKTGSSKSAIAKYIDRVYSNLPGTHSALLTHHLKRLKESGQLVMIKYSYKLAGSAPVPQVQSNGPKRRPGRPDKPKPAEIQQQPPPVNVTAGPGPGLVSVVPESLFASLGLVDGPVVADTKRRSGRPRKAKAEAAGGPVQAAPTPAAVAGVKKRPGRPAKNAAAVPAVGRSKGRGRPPKNSVYTGKPRGRPPKNAAAAAAGPVGGVAATPVLVPTSTGYVADAAITAPPQPTTASAAPKLKRRGRPSAAAGEPKRPRQLSGKPLGRPKKIGPAAPAQVSNLQQLMAYQELRSKLDFFQSRIKQTVGVLRPCLNAQSSGNALAALQELEELAAIDVTAPLNLQNRQPPPPENQV